MTSEQLGYKLAPIVLALVLFLILMKVKKMKSGLLRNVSIVVMVIIFVVSIFSTFGIEQPLVFLILTILVSAFFLGQFNKKGTQKPIDHIADIAEEHKRMVSEKMNK